MLYRHSDVFRTLIGVVDLGFVALAWWAAYGLRFHAGLPVPLGVPPLAAYLYPLPLVLVLFLVLFQVHGVYQPRRLDSPLGEVGAVVRATGLAILSIAAATFFARSQSYSRLMLGFFAVLAPTFVLGFRGAIRFALRQARRRGYNLRYVLIVGAGPLAESVIARIAARPDAGIRVLGVVADGALGGRVGGTKVIGGYGDLRSILASERVDQLIVALSRHESDRFDKVVASLADEVVSVKIVPDLLHDYGLRSTIESLDGIPMIGLQETALVGWPAVGKRTFDFLAAATALFVLAPALVGIAVAVLTSSGRPIFYRQTRMGHDGRVFEMLKFRSMHPDAEAEGPGWTRRGDPRRTRIGRILRRFDLDELPQLVNVLRGEMSLVGPRPERPAYIDSFRREMPGYMLRHKVRAGMTGWAQVHGWRGDTSIQERLEHDLYYIQRWSFALDLRILAMTLLRLGRSTRDRRAPADFNPRDDA